MTEGQTKKALRLLADHKLDGQMTLEVCCAFFQQSIRMGFTPKLSCLDIEISSNLEKKEATELGLLEVIKDSDVYIDTDSSLVSSNNHSHYNMANNCILSFVVQSIIFFSKQKKKRKQNRKNQCERTIQKIVDKIVQL